MRGTLYLCGGGNSEGVRLALSIQAESPRYERMLVLDDDPAKHGRALLGVEIAGGFEHLAKADRERDDVTNLVARTTARRAAARARIASFGVPPASLVSPRVDTLGAELPRDLIVYQNATIGPEVVIGEGCVVFMGAVVGHECRVAENCVIAANAVLNARVELGEGVYVGTNATVLPEVKVGAWATIGAGSVVVEDVPPHTTVMGVPAHMLGGAPSTEAAPPIAQVAMAVDPEIERRLRAIWEGLLGRRDLDPAANFFDLGGTSLLTLRMREQVEREFGQPLSLTEIFRYPSLRALAAALVSRERARAGPSPFERRLALRREIGRRLAMHS